MASSSRIQPPAVNLKERIAALQQRTGNAPPNTRPTSPPLPLPTSSIHSLHDAPSAPGVKGLRDKIAKFEQKGGVPIPRGSFGLGAPPLPENGQAKRRGELYGNRIPAPLRSGVLTPQVTGGAIGSFRSVSSPASVLTPQFTGGSTLSPQVTGGTLASWRSTTSSPQFRATSPTDPSWSLGPEEGSFLEHVTKTSSFADLALPDTVTPIITPPVLAPAYEEEEPLDSSPDRTLDTDVDVPSDVIVPINVENVSPPMDSASKIISSLPPLVSHSSSEAEPENWEVPSTSTIEQSTALEVLDTLIDVVSITLETPPVPDVPVDHHLTLEIGLDQPVSTTSRTPVVDISPISETTESISTSFITEDIVDDEEKDVDARDDTNDASAVTETDDGNVLAVNPPVSDQHYITAQPQQSSSPAISVSAPVVEVVSVDPPSSPSLTPTLTLAQEESLTPTPTANTFSSSNPPRFTAGPVTIPPPSPRPRSMTTVTPSMMTSSRDTSPSILSASRRDSQSYPISKLPTSEPESDYSESASHHRPSTFSAVVHKKVTEPAASIMPRMTMPSTPVKRERVSYTTYPLSPGGGGELTKLAEDAALLELLLSGGELPSDNPLDAQEVPSIVATQAELQEDALAYTPEPEPESAPEPPRSTPLSSLKTVLSRSKSAHGRAPSEQSNSAKQLWRQTALPLRDSRLSVLATPVDQDVPPTPPPKSPGRDYGALQAASSGAAKRRPAAVMPGAYPRDSVSVSSEDSVAVITPPDNTIDFPSTFDNSSIHSFGNAASTLSVTEFGSAGGYLSRAGTVGSGSSAPPKKSKSFSRAASFAGKMFQRARTKSSGSTISASDVARRMASDAMDEPLPTQSRKSLGPSVTPRGLQPPSPTYPTSPDRPESWISVSSTTSSARTVDLFDAFPSVPQNPDFPRVPADSSLHITVPFPITDDMHSRPSF